MVGSRLRSFADPSHGVAEHPKHLRAQLATEQRPSGRNANFEQATRRETASQDEPGGGSDAKRRVGLLLYKRLDPIARLRGEYIEILI